jgi:hypothetical protein
MSAFSAEWLSLREPIDHRSRNQALQAKVLDYLAQVKTVEPASLHITDLGSGTGSNLRALAPHLSSVQYWTLVDYDQTLLHLARSILLAWADSEIDVPAIESLDASSIPVKPLSILKQNKKIIVKFKCINLLNDYPVVLNEPTDLITAAAFFDLVAEPWLIKFCTFLTKPLYTVLTYDGNEKWSPPEIIDTYILNDFHQHQRTDKGFGRALGPAAAKCLQSLLDDQHFTTICAPSPWTLDHQDRTLIKHLTMGTARAVREMDTIPLTKVNQWEQSRMQASRCEIGHIDIFSYKKWI